MRPFVVIGWSAFNGQTILHPRISEKTRGSLAEAARNRCIFFSFCRDQPTMLTSFLPRGPSLAHDLTSCWEPKALYSSFLLWNPCRCGRRNGRVVELKSICILHSTVGYGYTQWWDSWRNCWPFPNLYDVKCYREISDRRRYRTGTTTTTFSPLRTSAAQLSGVFTINKIFGQFHFQQAGRNEGKARFP